LPSEDLFRPTDLAFGGSVSALPMPLADLFRPTVHTANPPRNLQIL
jgi:hypothetical protein